MKQQADIGPEISKKCVEIYCKDINPLTVEAVEQRLLELKNRKCCGSGCFTCIKTVWARFETHIQTMKNEK